MPKHFVFKYWNHNRTGKVVMWLSYLVGSKVPLVGLIVSRTLCYWIELCKIVVLFYAIELNFELIILKIWDIVCSWFLFIYLL